MTFQLVRASDTEIAIWQTEHGHIYSHIVAPDGSGLELRLVRAAPGSQVPPEQFAEAALAFATREAEVRNLVRRPTGPGPTRGQRADRERQPA